MRTVTVNLETRSYPIYIGSGLLQDPQIKLPLVGDEVLVVTNTTIAALYLPLLKARCTALNYHEVLLPDGEAYKDLNTLNQIFDALMSQGHSRKTTLLALGGGVVGDMTGFAAACYQRGVAFVQIPTTLLAQVDSAVGGKTAVNHARGKNMIGSFHQPLAVISDVDLLKTLPEREYAAGLAEVLKYGLIWDAQFFAWLEANQIALNQRQADALIPAIARSCEIKAKIVSQDPTEQGIRAYLNLGHTFAHAIEQTAGYGRLLHGEAVAIGLCLALDLSQQLGLIEAELTQRTKAWLRAVGLPVQVPTACRNQDLMAAMALDKKRDGKVQKFIVLRSLGHAEIRAGIDPALIERVLDAGREC